MKLESAKLPTRRAYSDRMAERGQSDPDFAVFESDIGYSTYSYLFGDRFPERYFNFGIAELSTMAAAAGMASTGRRVVVSGYGVFLTMRAVEVVRSFVCYPNLNVKLLSSHGGLTAAIDGVTHQATEDIAFMTTLPNMKVLCPADPAAARAAFDLALDTPGPVFTRLMRDPLFEIYGGQEGFALGGSKTILGGNDITIAAYGDMVFQAILAAESLGKEGIAATVIDLYSIKPLDEEALFASAGRTGALLVVENHQRRNGLGSHIGDLVATRGLGFAYDHLGLSDTFAESGDYRSMIVAYGISDIAIVEAARGLVARASPTKGPSKC